MKRASTLLTWWYLAIGGALAAAAGAASTPRVRDAIYVLGAAQALPVVLLAARRHGLSHLVSGALVAVGGVFAAADLVTGHDPTDRSLTATLLRACATAAAAGGLFHLLRRRGVSPSEGLYGDSLIVALAGWVVGWAGVVQPLVRAHGANAPTLAFGLVVPAAALALFLAAVVLLDPRQRPLALWFAGGTVALWAFADLLTAMASSGHMGSGAERVIVPLRIAAFVLLGATVLHPSVTSVDRRQNQSNLQANGRLAVTIAVTVLAVVTLASSTAEGAGDKLVRAVSVVALAVAVIVRVVQAVQANNLEQAKLLHGAQTDPLTGLPNRSVLLQEITNLLGRSWKDDQFPTLYFIDLDRFKNINDSLGHAAGDEVLVTVAQRLRTAIPESAVVARISGDEYVVLDPATASHEAAMALAEHLLGLFREPLALSHGDVFVTASIGVAAISATSSTSPEDLVRHADTAMYRAKDAGRNKWFLYDESMHEKVAHRLQTETALYRAVDRDELRLYHQPIIDLHSGEVVGFEALMRWQQTDGRVVSPAEFIPIAEETGTIVQLGSWALLEALNQLQRWIDDGVCNPTATMSVNVSPRQLADPNFPSIVSEALTRSGVSPQLLWLEVTESVMITDPELALSTLQRLRSLGVRVALDDFGTGYSSLSLLQKFPLQRIKIDRAFVQGVADNPNDRSLVRTIVAMGRSLGLDMVAEGVESVHQLQVLSDLGCGKAQGFLISHPVPSDAMRSTVAALERLGHFPGLRPSAAPVTS